ncbi:MULTISPECIES: AfsR/SARP family transcriptional regulator [unclassified Streptomyces]|uniref:AfsR/SARP family transcriptional regulator n=1 Tax=Streptomyces sp. NPDC127532 TaxID=3345399 RepID=UPI0036360E2A
MSEGTLAGGRSTGRLRIDVLGPVSARRGTARLDIGPVRRQAVLATLVLSQGRTITREHLLDSVWGTRPPATGRRVLPSYVYPLRKALDPEGTIPKTSVIRGDGSGYRFVLDDTDLDTADLRAHTDAGRRARDAGDLATATDRFTAALALFTGEPLDGLPGPFAQAERQQLSQRRGALQAERLECLIRLGCPGDALDELAALTLSDPLNEPLSALRMRALYAVERQDEALKVFEAMRVRLADELGVSPGKQIRRVHEAVLRRDDAFLLDPAPARPARARRVVNDLPGAAAQLTGRTDELGRLTAPSPSGSVSVVTVDGTAGVGKTTLVLQAAHQLRSDYPDGSLYVNLQAYSEGRRSLAPQRALRRLLRSLGEPSDLDELTAAWRTATSSLRLLLVLDDAVGARQVGPLLPAGPGSRVLVTGRRRLADLDADLRVTLEPLETGGSVSLLGRLAGKDRAEREPEALLELARLCDGLPLALRIVGARLQTRPTWTLAYMVERMAGDEGRLGELSAGDRSVEAAFRLSYEQLPPPLRHGFRVLGIAPTAEVDRLGTAAMLGCPAADAEEVLEGLVDASLLQQPGPGRYRLHDLVRTHARRLARTIPAEEIPARTAVLRLYLDAGRIASDWGPDGFPTGPQPTGTAFSDWKEAEKWLDAAGAELPDVVAYAVALGETDHACWIAEALSDYLLRRGRYHEYRSVLETALALADQTSDRRMAGALRNCMGAIDCYQGRFAEARTWFTAALRISRQGAQAREEAFALAGLGITNLGSDRNEEAALNLAAAVALAEAEGDRWVAGLSLGTLGMMHHRQGHNGAALDCLGRAYLHAEAGGRPLLVSRALCGIADVQLALGRHDAAKDLFRRALDLISQNFDRVLQALLLARLGSAEEGAGDVDGALAHHHEALARHSFLEPSTEPHYYALEMDIRCRLGQTYATAGRLREAHEQFRAALAVPGAETHALEHARAEAGLRASGTA